MERTTNNVMYRVASLASYAGQLIAPTCSCSSMRRNKCHTWCAASDQTPLRDEARELRDMMVTQVPDRVHRNGMPVQHEKCWVQRGQRMRENEARVRELTP